MSSPSTPAGGTAFTSAAISNCFAAAQLRCGQNPHARTAGAQPASVSAMIADFLPSSLPSAARTSTLNRLLISFALSLTRSIPS